MTGEVRVLVYLVVPDEEEITTVYHQVSKELAGTPGLLGNELMRSAFDPKRFMVLSRWQSMEAFKTWEVGASHKETTSPLRPYHDTANGPAFGIYEVTACY